MNEDLYVIILILGLPLLAVIIEALFFPEDDRPHYKEKFRTINRNENDTILDRRDNEEH